MKALLVLIIIGLILPTIYMTASSPTRGIPRALSREYQFSARTAEEPHAQDIEAVLKALAGTIDPANLNFLRDRLKNIVRLPSVDEDLFGQYIRTLSNFTDGMIQIDTKLQTARKSVASGNTIRALAEVQQLKELRNKGKGLLDSLYSSLDRIDSQYKIDTTPQLEKVEELELRFQSYSDEIDQLSSRLETQQGLTETSLILSASRTEVFVGEFVLVYGLLRTENGTALSGRNITIAWESDQITVSSNVEGRFQASINFSSGFPSGVTYIDANFEPEGQDRAIYLPSSSRLQIQVVYRPSILIAEIYPTKVKPLDFVYVRGNLSADGQQALANRMIIVELDRALLGNMTTSSSGLFWFRFSTPPNINNGTHVVTVVFNATQDVVAPSNATLPLIVELVGTQTSVVLDRSWVFSGMRFILAGNVAYINATFDEAASSRSGNLTIYVSDIPYGNVTVGDDGTFATAIQIPLTLSFGSYSIKVQYAPSRPWLQNSTATVQVSVYNTPLIVLAGVGGVSAVSVIAYLARRNRRARMLTVPVSEPTAPKELVLAEEYSREALISALHDETDDSSRVRRAYSLAVALIAEKLGEAPRESETHWEYFAKVSKAASDTVKARFKRLSELFEFAEYSPYPIGSSQSNEAMDILLQLREEIQTVK